MDFLQILKEGFINSFTDLTLPQAGLVMLTSIVCGLIICLVYKLTYRGVLFSRSFCVSIFAMELITTLLILAIRTNVYLSLGTLGALSIVRFRTAIKEPMDIAFLFLAVCSGVICGGNLLGIAVAGVVLVGTVLIIVSCLPQSVGNYIMMITVDDSFEDEVIAELKRSTKSAKLKSKAISGHTSEMAFEITLKNESTVFLNKLGAAKGVSSLSIVKASNEYI